MEYDAQVDLYLEGVKIIPELDVCATIDGPRYDRAAWYVSSITLPGIDGDKGETVDVPSGTWLWDAIVEQLTGVRHAWTISERWDTGRAMARYGYVSEQNIGGMH